MSVARTNSHDSLRPAVLAALGGVYVREPDPPQAAAHTLDLVRILLGHVEKFSAHIATSPLVTRKRAHLSAHITALRQHLEDAALVAAILKRETAEACRCD